MFFPKVGTILQSSTDGQLYCLEQPIGEGEQGFIWRARRIQDEFLVALKLIKIPPYTTAEDRDLAHLALIEEAFIGRKLQESRHFADVYDVFYDPDLHDTKDGLLVTVMELIHGFDLEELFDTYISKKTASLGGGFLPWEIAFSILSQALQGLEDTQSLQIQHQFTHFVHRDLKPSNLMLTLDGTVKILDMGLAKYDQRHPLLHTQFGRSRRLSVFASPEQITQRYPVSVQSDIFSLGAILYLLTTRCTLSGTLDPAHHIRCIERYRAKDLRPKDRNPSLPDIAVRTLLAFLAEDPQQRPQDPQTARKLLHDALAHENKPLWTPQHLQTWLAELFGRYGQIHRNHTPTLPLFGSDPFDCTSSEDAHDEQPTARWTPPHLHNLSIHPPPKPAPPPQPKRQRATQLLLVGVLSALGTFLLLCEIFGYPLAEKPSIIRLKPTLQSLFLTMQQPTIQRQKKIKYPKRWRQRHATPLPITAQYSRRFHPKRQTPPTKPAPHKAPIHGRF